MQAVDDLYIRVIDLSEFVHRIDNFAIDTETPILTLGQTSFENHLKLFLRGTLHSQLPVEFEEPIRAFYTRALRVFHARKNVENTEGAQ